MRNTEKKIKSEILVSEIQSYTYLLNSAILKEQDINSILIKIIFLIRKLDKLNDDKLSVFDDDLTNIFIR